MTTKRTLWYPISIVLSAVNLGAVWFAARPGEATHATAHAVLAVACAVWAQWLHRRATPAAAIPDLDGLRGLEHEVGSMRQELAEAQDRLDFAERMLAQGPELQRAPREAGPHEVGDTGQLGSARSRTLP